MKIVCIGSSLVSGFPVRRSECWVSLWRLASGHEIINKGVNGSTSGDLLARFQGDVIFHKPRLVVLLSGTNDFLLDAADPEIVLQNFKAMCEIAVSSDIRPVIATSLPIDIPMATERWAVGAGFDYPKAQESLARLRDLQLGLAARSGFQVLDFHALYEGLRAIMTASELYIDGIHPTATGHRLIAESIAL